MVSSAFFALPTISVLFSVSFIFSFPSSDSIAAALLFSSLLSVLSLEESSFAVEFTFSVSFTVSSVVTSAVSFALSFVSSVVSFSPFLVSDSCVSSVSDLEEFEVSGCVVSSASISISRSSGSAVASAYKSPYVMPFSSSGSYRPFSFQFKSSQSESSISPTLISSRDIISASDAVATIFLAARRRWEAVYLRCDFPLMVKSMILPL